jgi:hypothetical protein
MTIAALKALCSRIPWCEPTVLESILEPALEIAREGREVRTHGNVMPDVAGPAGRLSQHAFTSCQWQKAVGETNSAQQ